MEGFLLGIICLLPIASLLSAVFVPFLRYAGKRKKQGVNPADTVAFMFFRSPFLFMRMCPLHLLFFDRMLDRKLRLQFRSQQIQ